MTERFEKAAENRADLNEYSFEEGVKKIHEKIEQLLAVQPHAVLAINGIGCDVGKTFLSTTLMNQLLTKGIPVGEGSDHSRLERAFDMLGRGQGLVSSYDTGVILLSAYQNICIPDKEKLPQFRKMFDDLVNFESQRVGLPVHKIDFWIGLRRPDRDLPVNYFREKLHLLFDILVCNENAIDKSR